MFCIRQKLRLNTIEYVMYLINLCKFIFSSNMFCYNLKSYITDNCVSVCMIENKVYFVVFSFKPSILLTFCFLDQSFS